MRTAPAPPPDPAYPMVLNTGRVRDHWHTMTRTGQSPRLSSHITEPFVALHPTDAVRLGIASETLVEVSSPRGRMIARAQVTDVQQPGSLFAPMHWNDQFASNARVDALIPPHTCPVSGQPASKRTAVDARPFAAGWYGFAVLRKRPAKAIAADYWAIARVKEGWQVELAGLETCAPWPSWALGLLADSRPDAQLLTYVDAARHQHRIAVTEAGRFVGILFVSSEPLQVARGFLASALLEDEPAPADVRRLLAGRPGKDRPDDGPIVCSCFQVGRDKIARTAAEGCETVASIGERLKAGTNCGSCRTEIQRIIGDVAKAREPA